jgi:DNA-binding CsgD family transcriptional regulator/predicted ATPase
VTSLSLVGHSDDLSELTHAWLASDAGRGWTVVVIGESGVGKSRLVTEALAMLRPAPRTVLTGAARLHSPAPYDWLAAVLDRAAPPASGAIPAPADALAWLAQDLVVPRERYAPEALLRIAVRVVRALVADGPAVLVAEDLHALDPASLNLLAALAAKPDLPALLIATSRPPVAGEAGQLVADTLARLGGAPGATRIHVRPLGRDEIAAALRQHYAADAVTDAVVDAVVRRGGGNPYRLTELLADLGRRDPAALLAADAPPAPALTARERDVLSCIAAGMANKNIARALGISIRTVAVHVSNLLRKTGTASRTDAALWALRHDVDPAVTSDAIPGDPMPEPALTG